MYQLSFFINFYGGFAFNIETEDSGERGGTQRRETWGKKETGWTYAALAARPTNAPSGT